jgi:hypothetical protein
MKNFFLSFAAFLLLAGCTSCGSGPANSNNENITDNSAAESTAETSENAEGISTNPIIAEEKFIDISAQILCLPEQNPETDEAEIEKLASEIFTQKNVTEADFNLFQDELENDTSRKSQISYSIIAKMEEFCGGVAEDNSEVVADNSSDEEVSEEVDTEEVSEETTEEEGNETPEVPEASELEETETSETETEETETSETSEIPEAPEQLEETETEE